MLKYYSCSRRNCEENLYNIQHGGVLVKALFELTQAKKLGNVMVITSVMLFAFSYTTYRFKWFEG